MIARELMSGQPALIVAEDTLQTAAELMRSRCVGLLPVVDDLRHRRLVGVITDRDIVVRGVARGHGPDARVRDHMSRELLVIASVTTDVETIAERMRQHQVRRLPIVDPAGQVVGVVAQADLARAIGRTDPRLVEEVLEGISRPGTLVRRS